jgi:hypothetical protein
LRTSTDGPFAIALDRAELELTAESRPEIEERAHQVDALLEARGTRALASYGVGGAVLEVWLERLRPHRRLTLTDYGPETVERLRQLFPEARVVRHDLRKDPPLEADIHLFHRIDTEFTNREWRHLLRRFERETILVVATEIADFHRVARELIGRLGSRHLTRAGWLRTRDAFEALWRPTHAATPLHLRDLDAWLLEPRVPLT